MKKNLGIKKVSFKQNIISILVVLLMICSSVSVVSNPISANDTDFNDLSIFSSEDESSDSSFNTFDDATKTKIQNYYDSLGLTQETLNRITSEKEYVSKEEFQDAIESIESELTDSELIDFYDDFDMTEINTDSIPDDFSEGEYLVDENGNYAMTKSEFEVQYGAIESYMINSEDTNGGVVSTSGMESGINNDGKYLGTPQGGIGVIHLSVDTSVDYLDMPALTLGVNKSFNTLGEEIKLYDHSLGNGGYTDLDFNSSEEEIYNILCKCMNLNKQVSIVYEPCVYSCFSFNFGSTDTRDYALGVDYNVNHEEDVDYRPGYNDMGDYSDDLFPYPIAENPWIELLKENPYAHDINLKYSNTVFIKLNTTNLEPGSYLAYILVTPIPEGLRESLSDVPEGKLAALGGEIEFENETYVIEQTRIPVRINVWPDPMLGSSLQYEIVGNMKDQVCSYTDGGLTGYKRSVILDIDDFGLSESLGDSIYWIHDMSECDVDFLPGQWGRIRPDGEFDEWYGGFWDDENTSGWDPGGEPGELVPIENPEAYWENMSERQMHPGKEHNYVRIVTPKHDKDVEIVLHVFPDFENTDNIESNMINYRIIIRFDDFNEDKFVDYGSREYGITVLPSIGSARTVKQGETVSFNLVSWNKFPDDHAYDWCGSNPYQISPLADFGGAPDPCMVISEDIFWHDWDKPRPTSPDDNTINREGIDSKPGGLLTKGGSLFGEYVHYRITCGGLIVPEGDKGGRHLHTVSIDTTDLEPGTYTRCLSYEVKFNQIIRVHINERVLLLKPALLVLDAIPLQFTVVENDCAGVVGNEEDLNSDPNHTDPGPYYEAVSPLMQSRDVYNYPYWDHGLDKKFMAHNFSIKRYGYGRNSFTDLYYEKTIENNLYGFTHTETVTKCIPNAAAPQGFMLNYDRSFMLDVFPKTSSDCDEAVVLPRMDGYVWGASRPFDPAIGRPMTPKSISDFNSYFLINNEVVHIDSGRPYDVLKTEVIDPTDGKWSDKIPATYDYHPCYSGVLPRSLYNEIDILDWDTRRNPHVGKWKEYIWDVPVGSTLTFRANIDLNCIGEGYPSSIKYPLNLDYILPDGIEYEHGSAKARPGYWLPDKLCWLQRSISYEPQKYENGVLTWNIQAGKIYDNDNWPWKVLGKELDDGFYEDRFDNFRFGNTYYPVNIGGYGYLFSSNYGSIEITFNVTITKNVEKLKPTAYLNASVPGVKNYNTDEPEYLDYNNVLPISDDSIAITTKPNNQAPIIEEVRYPVNGETEVPIMNDELSVRVSDPDGDRVSVSFYWADDSCVNKENTYDGGVPGHFPPHKDVYEWKTKRYMIQTRYDVPSGSIVSVDPRPVVYKALPGPIVIDYNDLGEPMLGTSDDALILKDPVIQGLEFDKNYSWYVVVSDKGSSTKSDIYNFTTKNSEPDLKLDFTAQYTNDEDLVTSDNSLLDILEKREITIGLGENLSIDMFNNVYDPEGLIRGYKWSCYPISDSSYSSASDYTFDGKTRDVVDVDDESEPEENTDETECHCKETLEEWEKTHDTGEGYSPPTLYDDDEHEDDTDGDGIPDDGLDGNGDGDYNDDGEDNNGDGDYNDEGDEKPDIPPDEDDDNDGVNDVDDWDDDGDGYADNAYFIEWPTNDPPVPQDHCYGWMNTDEKTRTVYFTGQPGKYELTVIPYWDRYSDSNVPEVGPPSAIALHQEGWPGYPDGKYLNYFLGFLLDGMPQSLGYFSHDWVNEFKWTINVVGKPFALYSYTPARSAEVDETVFFDGMQSYDSYEIDPYEKEGEKHQGGGIISYNWSYKNHDNPDMDPIEMIGIENTGYFAYKADGPRIAYKWDSPGVYDVTLNVKDASGYSDTVTHSVYVGVDPGDDFDSDGSGFADDPDNENNNQEQNDDNDTTDEDLDEYNEESNDEQDYDVSIEFTKPAKNKLYFRDKEICRFPLTVAIGNIDIKVTITDEQSSDISDIVFFVDGVEIQKYSYDSSQSEYTYCFDKQGVSLNTIKVALYSNDEEIASKSTDVLMLNLFKK